MGATPQQLLEGMTAATSDAGQLRDENRILREENTRLKDENERLQREVASLGTDVAQLMQAHATAAAKKSKVPAARNPPTPAPPRPELTAVRPPDTPTRPNLVVLPREGVSYAAAASPARKPSSAADRPRRRPPT
jgi:cell division septum initiation protein DivIVA